MNVRSCQGYAKGGNVSTPLGVSSAAVQQVITWMKIPECAMVSGPYMPMNSSENLKKQLKCQQTWEFSSIASRLNDSLMNIARQICHNMTICSKVFEIMPFPVSLKSSSFPEKVEFCCYSGPQSPVHLQNDFSCSSGEPFVLVLCRASLSSSSQPSSCYWRI